MNPGSVKDKKSQGKGRTRNEFELNHLSGCQFQPREQCKAEFWNLERNKSKFVLITHKRIQKLVKGKVSNNGLTVVWCQSNIKYSVRG